MTDVIIRRAKPEDADAACIAVRRSITESCSEDHRNDKVLLAKWLRNKTPQIVRGWIESPGFVIVAEEKGVLRGLAMLGGHGTIQLCYLVQEARFRGIGKAMLQTLEAEARRRGMPVLDLSATQTAYAFYLRNGFVDQGKADSLFGLTCRRMAKRLG